MYAFLKIQTQKDIPIGEFLEKPQKQSLLK